jgi:hypothetical protein
VNGEGGGASLFNVLIAIFAFIHLNGINSPGMHYAELCTLT